jgi:hypothetical protein
LDKEANQQEAACEAGIAAQSVFGFPQGSRVVLSRSMADFIFNVVKSNAPLVGAVMEAMQGQTATVAVANDDLVEVRLDHSIELAPRKNDEALTYEDFTMGLKRVTPDSFEFSVTAAGAKPIEYRNGGLEARPEGKSFVFSQGAEPQLKITAASGTKGEAAIVAFTGPYLAGAPAEMRMFAPRSVGVINLSLLPDESA